MGIVTCKCSLMQAQGTIQVICTVAVKNTSVDCNRDSSIVVGVLLSVLGMVT